MPQPIAIVHGPVEAASLDAVALEHLDLAKSLARHFARRRTEPYDDLVQVACIGLLKAARRYDCALGEFRSYARRMIIGELKHFLRDSGWSVRPPRRVQDLCLALHPVTDILEQRLGRSPTIAEIAEEAGVAVEDVLAAREAQGAWRSEWLPTSEDPAAEPSGGSEDAYDVVELEALISDMDLSERDNTLLALRSRTELTQSEIAQIVGTSQMQVSRDLRRLEKSFRRAFHEANGPRQTRARPGRHQSRLAS